MLDEEEDLGDDGNDELEEKHCVYEKKPLKPDIPLAQVTNSLYL